MIEKTILQLFPQEYRNLWQQVAMEQEHLQELRLRIGRPVLIHRCGEEFYLGENGVLTQNRMAAHVVTGRELECILEHICHYSPYAYEEELRRGFITVAGGHRVGVTGQVVLEKDGSVKTIKNISCLNIRISHQIKGVADKVIHRLYRGECLRNALIIAPPGCGKTTLLRDLIRQISDGNECGYGMTVGVVDERSELAGSFQGRAQNDMGMRTDVLDGCPKKDGILMLLRAMSPQVIAIDEVGEREEWELLRRATACGCKLLATVHGESIADVEHRFDISRENLEKIFEVFLILGKESGKCVVKQILGK